MSWVLLSLWVYLVYAVALMLVALRLMTRDVDGEIPELRRHPPAPDPVQGPHLRPGGRGWR